MAWGLLFLWVEGITWVELRGVAGRGRTLPESSA